MIDHVIDKTDTSAGKREQQRLETRRSILDATVESLVGDGYANLTTRRIAERAGIAQSTLMHHFPTRELLLVEAVSALAETLMQRAVAEIDLSAARTAGHRAAVLEQAWRTFRLPEAGAALELFGAAWSDPQLAAALHTIEERLSAVVLTGAVALFPDEAGHPDFPVVIDTVLQVIRGLVMAIPTVGADDVDARWQRILPLLVDASNYLVPPATA